MRVRRIAAKELVIGSVVAALAIGSALTTTSQAAPGPTTQKPPTLVAEPAPSLTAAQSNEVNRYMVLTEMFWRKKQFKECIAAATHVILIDPGYDEPYSYRGQSYHRMEDFEQAITDLNTYFKLAKHSGSNLGAHRARGLSLCQFKKYADALKDFDVCVNAQPGTWDFWQDEAITYVGLHQFDKAISSATQLVKLSPVCYHYSLRAKIYFEAGKYKQSVDDWTKALSLAPQNVAYYASRAKCYDKLGQKDLAESDRKKRDSLSRTEF